MATKRPAGPKPALTEAQKVKVLQLWRHGVLQIHIAERYGLSPCKISEIISEMKRKEKGGQHELG